VVGAEVVFFGVVEQQLLGDDPVWDRVAVVKYPTRRSFIDMQGRPEFQESHKHKDAGMEQTFVIGCQPMDDHGRFGHVELPDWADVPHPPTAADGPIMVLHVIRFDEAEAAAVTPEGMQAYQSTAAAVAVPHGLRVAGWFAVEGTIIGDGRQWHQVRFNAFPSHAAFMAVVTDPARMEAHQQHRETAIADTYTMIVRPGIDRISESIHI